MGGGRDGGDICDHVGAVSSTGFGRSGELLPAGDVSVPRVAGPRYTAAGERNTESDRTTTSTKTTTYVYGTTTGQTHALDHTTGSTNAAYTYDKTGNTLSRPGSTATQALTWNSEDQLASLTEGTKKTGYLYDAGGNLLIRRDTGNGDTVLYLGDTEVHLTVNGTTKTLTANRYYTTDGKTIAVRTGTLGSTTTKLSFLASDPQGTATLSLDSTTWAITKRYTTPFGESRGSSMGPWPDDKGFLGKSTDSDTGLTHLGACEYDPTSGKFLSVDPLLDTGDNQSLNGYSYADNSPVTVSDPTGMTWENPNGDRCEGWTDCGPGKSDGGGTATVTTVGGSSGGGSSGGGFSGGGSGGGGFMGWLKGATDTVLNYGSAIIGQPDVVQGAGETALSIYLMGFGVDAMIGGGALCITPAGCIGGAPAIAGGVTLTGVGAVGIGDGMRRFSNGLGKALNEAGESSGGTSKPVVHRIRILPGKPMIGMVGDM